MSQRLRHRVVSLTTTIGALVLFVSSARAATNTFTVLIDQDDSAATGCTVPTANGPFTGVDHALVTTVDTVNATTANVTAVALQDCVSGALVPNATPMPSTPALPWPVGIANGLDGTDVIETFFPRNLLPPDTVLIHLAVIAGNDALTTTSPISGQPIILRLLSAVEVPTVGAWGMLALCLLLVAAAWISLRRRSRVAFTLVCGLFAGAAALWALSDLNGTTTGEWNVGDRLADDAYPDAGGPPDLRALFAQVGSTRIDLRIDSSLLFEKAPEVSATTPANGATGVGTSSSVTVTFDEPVDVTGAWFNINCATSGTHAATASGGPTTFTLDPAVDFAAGESCVVSIAAAQVTDQDTNDPPDNMAADYFFSFTTDAAPAVTTTVPTNGATGVTTSANLTIDFSEPVTVTGNWFQIVCATSGTRNVTDTVVTGGPSAFTVNPNVDFAAGESCTVTVFAALVTDQDTGDPPDTMAANFVFSFDTDAAPAVVSTNPPDAGGIAPSADVTVTFSEPVTVSGHWFAIVCGTSGTHDETNSVVTGGPTTFTIDPNVDFTGGESCTATIFAAQVADQDANDPPDHPTANHVFTFGIDAPPSVTATTPANGATGVGTSVNVDVTFSEAVNAPSGAFTLSCAASGSHTFGLSGGPTTFTLDPTADFTAGEQCTITVLAAQVTDQDSIDPPDNMAADYTATFTVDVAPDVTATTPTSGATGVGGATNLTITFSEPVNVTGNWFQIACTNSGTRNVVDTLVTGGPTVFTINPTADFVSGEQCTVTVFAAQLTDQDAGDPPDNMAADFVFSFTMDSAPTVTATTPLNGAVQQSTTGNLSVTFSEPVAVAGNWFQIVCAQSGTRNVADTTVTGGPITYTINPAIDFAEGELCTVTVFAASVTDTDLADPPDQMAANYVFSFTTDQAPAVTATTPIDAGFGANSSDLTITFSEPVDVTGNWFQIVCTTSGTRNVADTVVTGGPTTFTINPNTDFTGGESCTVTVFAAQVADQDTGDPPNNMAANFVFTFGVDAAPDVVSSDPAPGATGVGTQKNVTVTFTEPVNVTGAWFEIVCGTSGTHDETSSLVSGGPTTFTIDPNNDFAPGESCTFTVNGPQVSDQDANDPPDTMATSYGATFTIDTPPTVTATTPTNGATGVGGATDLAITFSEPVNVTGNWFQIVCTTSGTRNVADTVVTGGPTTFNVNPNVDFAAGESCTATVFAASVTDQDTGDPPDAMVANFVFSYSIDAAPSVTATTPTNGSTTAATTSSLTIDFSEPVNVSGNWFQIVCATSGTRNVADTVVSGGPSSFTVDPSTDFAAGELCTVTVFGTLVSDVDLADPPDTMVANFVFSFTTDAAPSVTATVPTNGSVASPSANLSITFSEPVDVTGNWFQIVCTVSGTRNVADTVVTGGPTTFTINPNVDFAGNESCTATVFAAQVNDQDANDPPDTMLANHVFGFSIDAPPSVTSTTPTDTATQQASNTNLTITFSEPVNVTGNWFQIVCTSGTRNVVDTVVTGGPTAFTVNPNADFQFGDACTVTVFAAQVTDQDANDPPDNMLANYVFGFTVDVAPTVTAVTPLSGAVDQASSTNLSVTFSEPMNVTGNWFQIVCTVSGTRNVTDTVVTGGPTTFTINPNVDFAGGESCTTTVFAAQVSDQDSGDPPDTLATNFVWSFTVDAAPSVTATTPTNGATGVAGNSNVTVTFSEAVNATTGSFTVVCGTSGTHAFGLSGGPTTWTLDPSADFGSGESCTLTVLAAQVTDVDANDPPDNMAANFTATFTVDTAPGVSTTTPANLAVNVPGANNLSVTFTEPVNVAGNWFTIVCGATTVNVADTVVTGGPTTFTINPSSDLPGNKSCTWTILAASVSDQDAADPPDNMLANATITFQTADNPPVAGADGYDTIGNTQLLVAATDTGITTPHVYFNGNVKTNDGDPDGDPITITGIVGCADVTTPFVCATANGGSVTLDATGTFTFTPKAGDTAASDSFQYTISDGILSANGTVTIGRHERVWYVQNNSAAGGVGRSNDPFDTLAEAQTASVANDWIFVYYGDGTTTGQASGITLKGGQHLIGEFEGLTVRFSPAITFNGTPGTTSLTLITQPGATACGGNPCRPMLDDTVAGAPEGVAATDVIPAEIAGLNLAGNVNGIDWTTTAAFAGAGLLEIRDDVVRSAGADGVDINLGGTGATQLSFHDNNLTAGANGLDIQEIGTGALTVTAFGNNVVSANTGGSGLVVNTARFDVTAGGAYDQVSGGTTVIGAPGNGVGGSGLVLTNVTGDLAFTDLDVFADNGAGVSITGAGAVNTGGGTGTRVTVGAGVGIIEATGGSALDLNNLTANFQLASLKSTNTSTRGVSLVNVTDGTTDAVFSAASGSTITTTAGAIGPIFNVSGGNADVSYAGTLVNSSGTARAVSIDSWAGDDLTDDVTFSGAITENGAGILVNNNSGTRPITFSGGMTITTTTGEGFAATGNGTTGGLHITGTNTITSTSAAALRVTNTTIGNSNITFRSISSGNGTAAADPANGIVLDTTGGSGHLVVTGTGGAGTGGTIRNSTGDCVSLNSTRDVSFNNVSILNCGRSGIDGFGVVNFTLTNSSIDNVGTAAAGPYLESNLAFNDGGVFTGSSLSGTVTITGNSLTNARRHGIDIENGTGTISNLVITGNTLTSSTNAASSLGTGILVAQQGSTSTTSHITTGNVSNNVVTNFPSAEGIAILGGSGNTSNNTSATLGANGTPIVISGNTIRGQSAAAQHMGSNAIRVSMNSQVGVANFTINGNGTVANPITNIQGQGISGFFGGTITGTTTITNNVIVANQTLGAGTQGLAVQVDDGPAGLGTSAADYNVTISNNNVSAYEGFGIRGIARASLAKVDFTIQNNTVGAPSLANRNGIRVDSGSATGDTTLCLLMTGNTSAGSGVNQGMGIRKQGTVQSTNEFGIVGLAPSPTTAANAAAKITANNPAGNGTDAISGDNFQTCVITP